MPVGKISSACHVVRVRCVFVCVLAGKGLKGRGGFCSCCGSQDGQLVDFLPHSAGPGIHGYSQIKDINMAEDNSRKHSISSAAPSVSFLFSHMYVVHEPSRDTSMSVISVH